MFNSELLPKGSANVSLKGATLVSLIPFPAEVDKSAEEAYNFGIFVNNENAKSHSGCSR